MYSLKSLLCSPSLLKNSDVIAKQQAADVLNLDLEDSIAASDKELARQSAAAYLKQVKDIPIALRINPLSSLAGLQDLVFLCEQRCFPAYFIVPKITCGREIQLLDDIVSKFCTEFKILAVIETVQALQNIDEIVKASPKLSGVIFGAADFATQCNLSMTWSALYFARCILALAAKAADIVLIDAPCFVLDNEQALIQEIVQAKELGFTGKIAIHPQQIKIINRYFLPEPNEIEYCEELLKIAKKTGDNVFKYKNQLIGPPILQKANQVIRAFKLTETLPSKKT